MKNPIIPFTKKNILALALAGGSANNTSILKKIRRAILNLLSVLSLLPCLNANAQTNPTPWTLSSGPFSFVNFTNTTQTTYPASMQGWSGVQVLNTPNAPTTVQADGNEPLSTNLGTATPGSSLMTNRGALGIGIKRSADPDVGRPLAVALAINTMGQTQVMASWTGKTFYDNLAANCAIQLQYRIGTSGNWTDVVGHTYEIATGNTQNFGPTALPAAVLNQSVVQLRWVYYHHSLFTTGDGGTVSGVIVTGCTSSAPPVPGTISGQAAVCAGVTAAYSIGSVTGASSYSWTVPPGATFTGQGTTSITVTFGTASGNITVAASNNCGSSAASTKAITVNPLPIANAGSDVTVCSGNSVTLNASGGTSYAWSPAAGLSNPNISDPVASPTLTTAYNVTVTGANGCSASDSVTVTLINSIVAYAGMDTAICSGASATLNASGGTDYSWSTGDTTASIAVSPIADTIYWVVVSGGSCPADTDSVFVIVSPALMDSVTITPPVCGNNDGSASVTVSGGVGFYTYLWSNGDTTYAVTGLTGMPPDTLIVTITDANGCTITDTAIVGCVSGVSESSAGLSINIFPNPFSGEFTINNLRSKIYDLEIYNLMGEKVYSPAAPVNKERVTLTLSDLPQGMYFLKIISESGVITKKIIKK